MKTELPEIIYLIDPCGELFVDGICSECGDIEGFCDSAYDNGPCWCADRQNPTDVPYKRIRE